jgi:hypothetical protein
MLTRVAHNNNEGPIYPREGSPIPQNHFVTRANDRELLVGPAFLVMLHDPVLEDGLSLLGGAVIEDKWDGGRPFLKLFLPVGEGAEWCNDQMRTIVLLLLSKESYQRDYLDGLACRAVSLSKWHLVGQ